MLAVQNSLTIMNHDITHVIDLATEGYRFKSYILLFFQLFKKNYLFSLLDIKISIIELLALPR